MTQTETKKQKENATAGLTNHDKDKILQAAEPFLIGGISVTRDFIVELWEKMTGFHVPSNILWRDRYKLSFQN